MPLRWGLVTLVVVWGLEEQRISNELSADAVMPEACKLQGPMIIELMRPA